MNEATPRWRAFSSEAPAPDSDGSAAPEPARSPQRWLLPTLAAIGGLAAGAAIIGMLVAAIGLPAAEPPFESAQFASAEPGFLLATEGSTGPSEIVVDVAGAVVRPGLHRLRSGDRVGDAIAAAGGYAPRADLAVSSQTLNLAQPLEDGAKVLVPQLGVDRAATAAAADDGRIDINRASQSELESLPGVGPVTARKIIDAREEGPFAGVRELRSRGIVGESVYEDIKSLVRAS